MYYRTSSPRFLIIPPWISSIFASFLIEAERQEVVLRLSAGPASSTQFTCFTGTKVQILDLVDIRFVSD
jgi:hypothetical protein